jgi:hypothetical protein
MHGSGSGKMHGSGSGKGRGGPDRALIALEARSANLIVDPTRHHHGTPPVEFWLIKYLDTRSEEIFRNGSHPNETPVPP